MKRFVKWKRLSKPCLLSTTRWRHTFSSLAGYAKNIITNVVA